jgi:hypothetical protein
MDSPVYLRYVDARLVQDREMREMDTAGADADRARQRAWRLAAPRASSFQVEIARQPMPIVWMNDGQFRRRPVVSGLGGYLRFRRSARVQNGQVLIAGGLTAQDNQDITGCYID